MTLEGTELKVGTVIYLFGLSKATVKRVKGEIVTLKWHKSSDNDKYFRTYNEQGIQKCFTLSKISPSTKLEWVELEIESCKQSIKFEAETDYKQGVMAGLNHALLIVRCASGPKWICREDKVKALGISL